jgi:membrane-associated phospholipid phosphatase
MILYLGFLLVFLALWAIFYATLPLLRHVGKFGANGLTQISVRWSRLGKLTERYGAYVPVAVILIGGALFTAWAGDGFLDLAEQVHAKSPGLQKLDAAVHTWAISERTPSENRFFLLMSDIGGPVSLIVIVVVVSIILLLKRRYGWFLYLAVTAGGGSLLNLELKRYFARARPDIAEMLRQASGYSFPSGHAMGSTVVFGALSYLAFHTATNWRLKSAMPALTITLIAAVSLSRVYLGVHWISDVVAGIAAGALWLGITTLAYETAQRIRMLRGGRVNDQ